MDVAPDGSTGNLRQWAGLQDIPEGENSGADGVAVDSEGRLYVTSVTGVQVFDDVGDYLETIAFPQQPSNVAFGGPDRMTLFATARTGLYSLRMRTAGHSRSRQVGITRPRRRAAVLSFSASQNRWFA